MADLRAWPLLAGLSTAMGVGVGVGKTGLERWAGCLFPGKACKAADIRYKVWAGGELMGDRSLPVEPLRMEPTLLKTSVSVWLQQPTLEHSPWTLWGRVHIGKHMLTSGSQLAFPPSSSWLQGYFLCGLLSLLRPPDEMQAS